MREGEPFKVPLEDSEYSHKIKLLEAAPDKVVREWDFDMSDFREKKQKLMLMLERELRKEPNEEIRENLKNEFKKKIREARQKMLEQGINKFKRGVFMFHNLKTRYGIAIPKMDFMIGGDDENAKIYSVVDKIIGENLEGILSIPLEAKEKLEEFYIALTQYYYDIFQKGGMYWWDFANKQIMYGHKKDEEDNKVYIIDVDPYYLTFKKDQENLANYLIEMVSRIILCVEKVEEKFSPRLKLTRTREKLNTIIINILYNDPSSRVYHHKGLSNLRERLRD